MLLVLDLIKHIINFLFLYMIKKACISAGF